MNCERKDVDTASPPSAVKTGCQRLCWSIGFALASLIQPASANDFVDIVTRAPKLNNSKGRLCFATNSRTDIGCSSDAPYLDTITGSVGIGAGAPAFLDNNSLYTSGHVHGNAGLYTGGSLAFNSTLPRYIIWNGSSSVALLGDPVAKYLAISTSNTEALRIVSSGNIGIRTSTPRYTLDVSGTIFARNGMFLGSNATNSRITSGPDAATYMSFHWGQPDITFHTNSSRRMVIASSNLGAEYAGRVGIGPMIYPSATLDVSGTLKISSAGEACDANRLGAMRYGSGSFEICRNIVNGWERLATPGAIHRITSGTTQAIAYNNASLSFVTNGAERMVIGSNGEVGIGKTAPQAALDVSGAIKVSGDGTEECSSATDNGKIRINPDTGHLQICSF